MPFGSIRRVKQPASEFLTLPAAKRHLGIDEEDATHDQTIVGLISVARNMIEARTSLTLTPTKWRAKFDAWGASCDAVELPYPPLLYNPPTYPLEITMPDGTVVDPADMTVDVESFPGRVAVSLTGSRACGGDRGTITWWAGWEDIAAIEPAIHQAGLMLVGHLFENREATTTDANRTLPLGVDALLASISYTGRF